MFVTNRVRWYLLAECIGGIVMIQINKDRVIWYFSMVVAIATVFILTVILLFFSSGASFECNNTTLVYDWW